VGWIGLVFNSKRDGVEFYQIRQKDGNIDPYSSGTIIFPNGDLSASPQERFQIEVLNKWKSQRAEQLSSKWKIKFQLSMELTLSQRSRIKN